MPVVDIQTAMPRDRTVIEAMMQLYIHDFSEHWAGTPRGELGEDGQFAPYPLDPYWRDTGHIPLIMRTGSALAGFALINPKAHSGSAVDHNMAEFFILRKHRRGGVGLAAAQAIFARFPGQWEAAVARRNTAALAFWRRAVGDENDVTEIDLTTEAWDGPVLRFRVG